MQRTGLVLGAGGVVGQAYHAGVLAALERDLGWDARTADVIVGSSAGSVTGALLRIGVPPEDLAACAVGAPLSLASGTMAEWLSAEPAGFPALSFGQFLRPWRVPSPALVARTLRRPWAFRAGVTAMTLMPDGRVDIVSRAEPLSIVTGDAWPQDLWVCAVRQRDGARVVFGRPRSPEASLADAVAASCAIPGYFKPVTIGGASFFDGGVHSSTNADVLRNEQLDLVIVVAPMSSSAPVARSADAPVRFSARRRLDREIRRLRATGTAVVRFEPGPAVLGAMGVNAMASDRSAKVVQEAFLEAGDVARRDGVAERLAPLATRSAWLRTA